jgi:hypothetical protein
MNSTEIFKEKEEPEIQIKSLDPDEGLTIEDNDIDLSSLYKKKGKTLKLQAFEDAHQRKENQISDLEDIEKPTALFEEGKQDLVALGEISEDFEEVLVSLEELIEYLDNSEEQIDV